MLAPRRDDADAATELGSYVVSRISDASGFK
jgi:hypothetical protein